MEEAEFDACIDQFRVPDMEPVPTAPGEVEPTCEFIVTPSKDPDADEGRYKILAKGCVD
jgi:hypothetical protein